MPSKKPAPIRKFRERGKTTDTLVIGRKHIVAYLRDKFNLSEVDTIAWNKLYRWRKRYGLDLLFHHFPSGEVYIVKQEVGKWAKMVDRISKDVMRPKKNYE